MQMAVAEFARHVVGMDGANSTEFDPETPYPVIDLLPEQKEVADMGGTMRLGADPIKLHEGTAAREIYGEAVIYERHRHRYEVNNFLRRRLEAAGLVISGTSPDERLVEVIEIHDHPFFVASQYHPEFKSRPDRPAPLFREFVRAALGRDGGAPAGGRGHVGRSRRTPSRAAPRAGSSGRREAGQRGGEGAPQRDVRRALPDLEPVRRGAGGRRRGGRGACGRWAWRSTRTTPPGPPARAPATCCARIPGRSERSILLCAHLDTVTQNAPIEPVVVDGGWENANDGILGADNKAAVAVILEVARRATVEGSPVGIELLFTVAEENGLLGAAHFDAGRLRSDFGYVFDHATPIGEVVTASPSYFRVGAEFHGRAAHAGIRPEEGRSAILAAALAIAAMPLGRIDDETTANVGSVSGGVGSTNVVARARAAARRGPLRGPREGRDGRGAHDRRDQRRRRRAPSATSTSRASACSRATARSRPRRRSPPPRPRCAPAATSRAGSPPAAGRTPTRSSSTASRA